MLKTILTSTIIPLFLVGALAQETDKTLYNVVIEKSEAESGFDIHYEVYLDRERKKDEYYITKSQDTFLLLLMRDLNNQQTSKNDLLIYIHGMWGGSGFAFNRASRLMHDAYIFEPDSKLSRILSIRWPGNTNIYKVNKEAAHALAPLLSDIMTTLIRKIQLMDYMDGRKDHRLNLMAHSLGNELLKESITYLDKLQFDSPMFDEIILAAPDLDPDLFESGQPLAYIHKLGKRCHVYYSQRDLTLGVSQSLNACDRLGVCGPSDKSLIQRNVSFVDVSQIKDEPNLKDKITGHSYYRISPLVTADMLRVMNGLDLVSLNYRVTTDPVRNFFSLTDPDQNP